MIQVSHEAFAAFVGIDWADAKHDGCRQVAGSAKRDYCQLEHPPEAIDAWGTTLRMRCHGQPVALCLALNKGPLGSALRTYDFLVLCPIHPLTLARYREAFTPSRAKDDPTDAALQQFYERLLTILKQPVLKGGSWQLLECTPGWDGNWTHDCLIAFVWQRADERLIVTINYSPNQSSSERSFTPMRRRLSSSSSQAPLTSASSLPPNGGTSVTFEPRSISIRLSRAMVAPARLILMACACTEKGLPAASVPSTMRSKATGTRGLRGR